MKFKMEVRRTSDGPTGPVIETKLYENYAELSKDLWGSADQQYHRRVTDWATKPTIGSYTVPNGDKFMESWTKIPEDGDR